MTDTFLPTDYSVPDSSSGYFRFKQGENRFRVLGSAILGSETWIEEDGSRKPLRFRMGEIIPADKVGTDPKHFWAFVVWNYQEKKVQILEITQKGIMKSIRALTKDEDWGDPKKYDIVVTREGEGMDTEYMVSSKPHKELEKAISDHYKSLEIDIEALYRGGDPFDPIKNKDEKDFKEVADEEIPFS